MALSGKVALITGGIKNLGAQSALELAGVGANLALHYHSSGSEKVMVALEAARKRKNPSIQVSFYQSDLTSAAAVTKLFQDVVRDFGQVDIVINTVGKVLKKPIVEITEEENDTMFAVNSKTAFFVLKEAAAHVSDGGKIVSIVTALLGAFTGYYTSYAGTFFYPQESPEAVGFHKANGMGGRLTMTEDIAPIIRFLCTDGAWITGQTIFANGGYTTR
ncbi:hypothetical protein N7451_012449 [Penicillium sp. IBT 35674x]|nr:hypothetical protein N7451_012449 [Penicillium sp. IBT 35674x]